MKGWLQQLMKLKKRSCAIFGRIIMDNFVYLSNNILQYFTNYTVLNYCKTNWIKAIFVFCEVTFLWHPSWIVFLLDLHLMITFWTFH